MTLKLEKHFNPKYNLFSEKIVRQTRLVVSIISLTVGSSWGGAQTQNPEEFFEFRIRPLLAKKCYSCHSETVSSGLRVDSRQSLLQGGSLGTAIVPGKPEESLLIQAVNHSHQHLRMPLGEKLHDQEISDLVRWVQMGAPWPKTPASIRSKLAAAQNFTITEKDRGYWAFKPVQRPNLPKVTNTRWSKSPIDLFILARLENEGLSPTGPATKRELVRRLSFDLIGLPPTPVEVDTFLKDDSPQAWRNLVNRLLDSPHYGERWGRHWLDIARYSEDDVHGPTGHSEYLNAWRYRDWVIQAFNKNMPFDLFVKAQIAGDLLQQPDREKLLPGTGFLSLGVWYYGSGRPQNRADERFDRIDVISRGFLGLTVGCARCHDHKYDPIAFKDYWALDGIMASTIYQEYPLASPKAVKAYRAHQEKVTALETSIKDFLNKQSIQLSEMLAWQTSRYLVATWKQLKDPNLSRSELVQANGIDEKLFEGWFRYLTADERDHPYLQAWDTLRERDGTLEEIQKVAEDFQAVALAILSEKKVIDDRNHITVESNKPKDDLTTAIYLPNGFRADVYCSICELTLEPIGREKYILWLDLFGDTDLTNSFMKLEFGLFRLQGKTLESYLEGEWKVHLETLRARLEVLKNSSPPEYAYIHGMTDSLYPDDSRIHIRGNPYDLGEKTPRQFLTVLSPDQPQPYREGSGRLQLAEAIAGHPLTARVMVNRIWQNHFGHGIVRTPSNFGRLGTPPTHAELLEYLADRFIQNHYSIKAVHREILLSATYQQSSQHSEIPYVKDPENRLLWRFNRRRLDAEGLRDSILSITGTLDSSVGGISVNLSKDERRRTVYGQVKRSKLDNMLALFDFPDPSLSSSQRSVTNIPSQKLFFLNSDLMWNQSGILANRISKQGSSVTSQTIQEAYRIVFGRQASAEEIELAKNFIENSRIQVSHQSGSFQQFLQILLSSNEFLFVD